MGGGGWGRGLQGKKETKGEHPRLFILTTNPPLFSPLPPHPHAAKQVRSVPSSTITAQQHDTTTNSASLTSHGKHSCMSALFACRPFSFPPLRARFEMCFATDALLWEGPSMYSFPKQFRQFAQLCLLWSSYYRIPFSPPFDLENVAFADDLCNPLK